MQIRNADDWAQEGKQLTDEALAILQQPEISAEDEEVFHRKRDAAGAAFDRSDAMQELNTMKAKAIAELEGQNSPAPQDAPLSNTDDLDGFKDIGHFLRSVYHFRRNQIGDERLKWFDDGDTNKTVSIGSTKALAESTGATGGVLVPAEFQNRLLSVMENETIVFPRAEIIRMSRRTITIPVLDQTGTTSGTPSFFGGMLGYWVGEAQQLTETQPAFRNITLEAHMLAAYTRVSEQLLSDSAQSLEDFFMGSKGFPGILGWMADYAYLRGDGVAKPTGIIGHAATLTHARAGAGAVAYADLTGMLTKLLPTSNPVWVIHQTVLDQLLQMSGPSGNPAYLWGSATAGVPQTLLGIPLIKTDRVPTLGTEGDVGLYDLSYYLVGDRRMTTVDVSQDERFQWVQTSWRATTRTDGKPWLSAAITYEDGSTAVSPFVTLTDAA